MEGGSCNRCSLSVLSRRLNSERVDSVRVLEERVIFRINFDIFPSTAGPSARDKMHLGLTLLIEFNI